MPDATDLEAQDNWRDCKHEATFDLAEGLSISFGSLRVDPNPVFHVFTRCKKCNVALTYGLKLLSIAGEYVKKEVE